MVRYPIMVVFGVGVIYLTLQICNKIFCKIRTCMCNDLNNSLHHVYLINMNREKYRYIIFIKQYVLQFSRQIFQFIIENYRPKLLLQRRKR